MFLSIGKRLRTDHPEKMPLKCGIVALCPYHGHLAGFQKTYNNVCSRSVVFWVCNLIGGWFRLRKYSNQGFIQMEWGGGGGLEIRGFKSPTLALWKLLSLKKSFKHAPSTFVLIINHTHYADCKDYYLFVCISSNCGSGACLWLAAE